MSYTGGFLVLKCGKLWLITYLGSQDSLSWNESNALWFHSGRRQQVFQLPSIHQSHITDPPR